MKGIKKAVAFLLVFCMTVSMADHIFTTGTKAADAADDEFYSMVMLDCGRKYFSADNIKTLIGNAADAGFNYVQLAFGNDGLRFLLDDMAVTVNETTYNSNDVKSGIQAGNSAYNTSVSYEPTTNELTETEMNEIIESAKEKGISIIPLLNTPGHMDAIVTCMGQLGIGEAAYNASIRTVDVTNETAVAFTQALVKKYVTYFAEKGCKAFNMGLDEYANDVYADYEGMGFGHLQSVNQYSEFVTYVNDLAKIVKEAGMVPMAFNDGIYYAEKDSDGAFDGDIVICYWSAGWGTSSSGYNPASASYLKGKGFQLVNTNCSYYWILGSGKTKCNVETANTFNYRSFL